MLAGYDVDPKFSHVLAETEPISHVTRTTGNVINNNIGKFLPLRCRNHILKAATVGVGARHSFVNKTVRQLDIVLATISGYFMHLISNTVYCLAVCAIPGIGGCSHNIHKQDPFF
nr:hypothetical protein [Pectinatus frisingensis]